jgi:hypothetical protein
MSMELLKRAKKVLNDLVTADKAVSALWKPVKAIVAPLVKRVDKIGSALSLVGWDSPEHAALTLEQDLVDDVVQAWEAVPEFEIGNASVSSYIRAIQRAEAKLAKFDAKKAKAAAAKKSRA